MDRKLWLLGICVAGLMFVAVGQKSAPKVESAALPRYQLVPAQISEEGESGGRLFLIDIRDGKVWKYQSAFKAGNELLPDLFAPIAIGIPKEVEPGYHLKNSASEDGGH
ncbi:MAG: hypothetical protein ABSD64_12740 [Terriglobales bacterium]|jgi:hypothetical protein